MEQIRKTEGTGYTSHMLGEITAEQFELADKPLTPEWKKNFAGTKIFPAILYIEKTQPMKELTGQQIYDILRKAGFSEGAANETMRRFSLNKLIYENLERAGYNVELLTYQTEGIHKKLDMVYETTVEVLSSARNDNLIIRPIEITFPSPECSFFEYNDEVQGGE